MAGSLSSRSTPMHEAGLRSRAARAVKPRPGMNSTTSSEAPKSGRACISCVGSRPPGCDTRLAHLRPAASTRVSCSDPGLHQAASHRDFRMQDPYIFLKIFIEAGIKYALCRNKQFDRFCRGTELIGSIGEPCASSPENGTTGAVPEPPTKRQDVPTHPCGVRPTNPSEVRRSLRTMFGRLVMDLSVFRPRLHCAGAKSPCATARPAYGPGHAVMVDHSRTPAPSPPPCAAARSPDPRRAGRPSCLPPRC